MIPGKDADRDFYTVWICVCTCTCTKRMQPLCFANERKVRLKALPVSLQLHCYLVALWIMRHLLGLTDFICCHLPAVAKFPANCVPPRPPKLYADTFLSWPQCSLLAAKYPSWIHSNIVVLEQLYMIFIETPSRASTSRTEK